MEPHHAWSSFPSIGPRSLPASDGDDQVADNEWELGHSHMKSDKLRRLLSQAESHWKLGRIAEAKSGYEHVLKQYPKSTEARFQLAVLLHDEDDLAGAVMHLQELTRLLPEVAEIQFNLGTILMRLGRKEEARESFRRAVELQPGMAEAHNNLGLVERDLGRLSERSPALNGPSNFSRRMSPPC